jgi:hypothetical protein
MVEGDQERNRGQADRCHGSEQTRAADAALDLDETEIATNERSGLPMLPE